jgi:hypothetical protein
VFEAPNGVAGRNGAVAHFLKQVLELAWIHHFGA